MREPDLSGVARAWRIKVSDELRAAHRQEWGYEDSGIDNWLINGPYHPAWSWWMVACVSLRPIEGAPPAHKRYPGAEYELGFYSLDGRPDIEALERGDLSNKGFRLLSPPDMIFQFHGISEGQARKLTENAVHAIVDGQSCDSDFRSWWLGTLETTVAHIKTGGHPEVAS